MSLSPSSLLHHEIIRASAGSGKTFQLAGRFIALLAQGVSPERIVALTFTKKAAGEFFERIVSRLAAASLSEESAAEVAQQCGQPTLRKDDFIRMLRSLIDAMPRLRLGTLDSFFAAIVRAFPFELGLSGGFAVPSASRQALDQQRVLGRLFRPGEELTPEQRDFFQAFKQATFGREDYKLATELRRFINERHEWFLHAPEKARWGSAEAIWPQGMPFHPCADVPGKVQVLKDRLPLADLSPSLRERWESFFDLALSYKPGSRLTDLEKPVVGSVLYKLLEPETWAAVKSGQAEISLSKKKFVLGPEACRAAEAIVSHLVAGEFSAASERTRGVWTILAHYEAGYDLLVRRAGKLTFSDVQQLLAGKTLSQRINAKQGKVTSSAELAFRLDAKWDHWLLDEFQDTSVLQWQIIQPLADEVLHLDDGTRTYFHVGDEKQALYGWRQGEARLTDSILNHYGERQLAEPGEIAPGIAVRTLQKSWRSSAEILKAVNIICGDQSPLHGGCDLPLAATERWRKLWRDHVGREDAKAGYVALIRPPEEEDAGASDEIPSWKKSESSEPSEEEEDNPLRAAELAARPPKAEWRVVAALLREMKPLERGLSCAVLFPDNKSVVQAAAWLQATTGMRTTSESKEKPAVDHPAPRLLLDLLRAAVHPIGSLAWGHVEMTPLAEIIRAKGWKAESLRREILQDIHQDGFGPWVRKWTRYVTENIAVDAFTRCRLAALGTLADQFDAEGSRHLDEFISFAESAEAPSPEGGPRAIQCMTIHKAKGLEFDLVFLPALDGRSLDAVDVRWLRSRSPEHGTEWLYRIDKKALAGLDPTLQSCVDEMVAEGVYERLCNLYVALTRAKRALFLICDQPGRKNKSGTSSKRTYARIVDAALTEQSAAVPTPEPWTIEDQSFEIAWEAGSRTIFASEPFLPPISSIEAKTEPEEAAHESASMLPVAERLSQHLRPVDAVEWKMKAIDFFSPGRRSGRLRGNLIHRILSRITWAEDLRPLTSWWQATHPRPLDWERAAWAEVEECLAEPSIRREFLRPGLDTELWRERPFEVQTASGWLSGTFDRVLIEPHRVRLIEFKTDALLLDEPSALAKKIAEYRPQVALYREALALLTGHKESVVSAAFIFTSLRKVIEA